MKKSRATHSYQSPLILPNGLCLSTGLAAAMLDWASEDFTRPQIGGLGVSVDPTGELWLGATDGHRLVRVRIDGTGLPCRSTDVWSADIVLRAIRLAKVDDSSTVILAWDDASSKNGSFPSTHHVMPSPGFNIIDGELPFAAMQPRFLLDAAKLTAAIDKVHDGDIALAVRAVNGSMHPVRFDVVVTGDASKVLAEIVIMPMRCTALDAVANVSLKAVA